MKNRKKVTNGESINEEHLEEAGVDRKDVPWIVIGRGKSSERGGREDYLPPYMFRHLFIRFALVRFYSFSNIC